MSKPHPLTMSMFASERELSNAALKQRDELYRALKAIMDYAHKAGDLTPALMTAGYAALAKAEGLSPTQGEG